MTDPRVSTAGLSLPTRSRALRDAVELLSSMRFAIALLTLICIASVIGTVVKQREPLVNYVNQFGPFWAELFGMLDLYTVYGAWWFVLILAFLVLSTSLCIARNAPKIVADLRSYKEQVRASSLKAFPHRAEGVLAATTREAALARVSAVLAAGGWKARAQVRDGAGGGVMVAARRGAAHKLGYLAAHGAIVLVCIGGLFDGDLVVRAQMALAGKTPYTGGALAEADDAHRLSEANPTYRGNLFMPEGQRSGTALLSIGDGMVLQPLPFDVELKKFIVEHYPTGQPKLFASEVLLHDRDTGASRAVRIEVNKPAEHRGVTIYQSSFEDGGSKLAFKGWPLAGGAPIDVAGTVGGDTTLKGPGGEALTLEFTGLRVINVENLGAPEAGGATDVRKVDLRSTLDRHLGASSRRDADKALQNVGPSVSYKLRDAAGQAREFNNYMRPVTLEGQRVFLAGLRENPNEPFRYLRIPADEDDGLAGWMRLRGALLDAAAREAAVARYVALAVDGDKPALREQLSVSARRALDLFAGAEPVRADEPAQGGLVAVSDFLEASVPEADRPRTSEVLLRILNGTLFELANLSRERAGLAPLPPGEAAQAFMTQAVLSLSDSFFYPAPVLLELSDYEHVQASVFQVARAPGQTLVYLGCLFLIVGVFAMLYVRERRLWVWLEDAPDGATRLTAALSSTRQTLDADREFEQLRAALLAAAPAPMEPSA